VLRHESLLHDIGLIDERMKGKATRGWKRMHLLSDLVKNRSYTEVMEEAKDRGGWSVINLLVTAED